MVKRQSPQMLAKQIFRLKVQRQKRFIKPPFNCPFCFGTRTVRVKKEDTIFPENRLFTFICNRGCFEETVICKSSSFEPVDGYNIVIDKLRQKMEVNMNE